MRWQISGFRSDGDSNFASSLTIYNIFANQTKFQKFDLENEDQGQGKTWLELFDWKWSIPYRWLFRNFSSVGTYVYANLDTHTHAHACTHKRTHTPQRIHTSTNAHTHTHTHMHVKRGHMPTHADTRWHARTRTNTRGQRTHMDTHTYTDPHTDTQMHTCTHTGGTGTRVEKMLGILTWVQIGVGCHADEKLATTVVTITWSPS